MKISLKPAALAALALVASLAASAQTDERKTYIVQLRDEPAATYQGTTAGLAATQPAAGTTFQKSSGPAQAYLGYLARQQDSVLSIIAGAEIVARYDTVFNGFAARLTEAEALSLRSNANVVDLFLDEPRKVDTVSTSQFLNLSTPGGVWSTLVSGLALKGENLVVGVIDTGIWPESPAFADRIDANGVPTFDPTATKAYAPLASWAGACQAGEGFDPAKHCNNKLIGARFYAAGLRANGLSQHWSEFNSPRDSASNVHGGHGDHTASTAAGNGGATAIVSGIPMGTATGVAPRARIAAYKVCWTYQTSADANGTNGCFGSDSVSAIDDAVKDGVQVINYSISGAQTTVNDPVEQAFYRASLAGVFVAASAGNAGPANTVAHISPWLTTVAASSHDRSLVADAKLGNGAKYTGASLNTQAVPMAALINAEDAGLPGADATKLKLCYNSPTVLDPAKVAGKVVVCTRGENARVDKSLAVANAGGAGMVLVDASPFGLVAEAHSVPTIHVSAADGALVNSYASTAGAMSSIGAFYNGFKPAPVMAGFSSRGPNLGDPNLLKPDLTAPGVDIIASVSAPLTLAQRNSIAAGTLVPQPAWASYQGTSMSAPHVAGLALLLRQAHPTWSPSAIKSALMTTGTSTLDDGLAGAQNGMLPWSQGAGHVNPVKAMDPGLVYDAGKADFVRYQCKVNKAAVTPATDCSTYGTLDETYNLNLPSITASTVFGNVTVTRRVTNVSGSTATYNASASLPGFSVTVTPSTLTLAPGETKSFTVKLTAGSAPLNTWMFGSLTWADSSHVVRMPVQAKAGRAIVAPEQFTATATSGSRLLTVKTGFAGKMGSKKGGLKEVSMSAPVTLDTAEINKEALLGICKAGSDTANVKVYNVNVPANTIAARFALRQVDVSGGAMADHDMMLLAPDGTTTYSGGPVSDEAVQVLNPAAGNHKVCVVAFGGAPSLTHSLSSWVVAAGDGGATFNTLLPVQVYLNSSATVGLGWSGLTAGKRYLGAVQFLDAAGTAQAATALRIETNGGLPVSMASDTVASKVASQSE